MIFWLILPFLSCFFFLIWNILWLCCCFILDFIYTLKWCGHLNVLEELDYLSGLHALSALDIWNSLHKRWAGLAIFRVIGYTEVSVVLTLNTRTDSLCSSLSSETPTVLSLLLQPLHLSRLRSRGRNRNFSPF